MPADGRWDLTRRLKGSEPGGTSDVIPTRFGVLTAVLLGGQQAVTE